MFSLEPFTLQDIGSPQVFQTGETFEGAPLIDYQHPHDLIMNLGGEYSLGFGATTVTIGAYAVGPAPLGPPVFMHRPSAAENPQAPLSHHYLDSTHITPGVISLGVDRAGFRIEAGAFHGQEPDEDRLDLDTGALDSYSVRGSWADGPWQFQVSCGDLKTPERTSPYDATRVTASASYFKGDDDRSTAWLAAFGQNREVFGNLESYLFEAQKRAGTRRVLHARRERRKGHPRCRIPSDRCRSIPIGNRRSARSRSVTFGTSPVDRSGGSGSAATSPATWCRTNLEESYGTPWSFHVFLRYHGRFGARIDHNH